MDLAIEEMPPAASPAFVITAEADADVPVREALLDRAMGPGWTRKSSEKLRRGRRPSEGLAFVARDAAGAVVGTVRLWDVAFDAALPPLSGEGGRVAAGWGEVVETTPSASPASIAGLRVAADRACVPAIQAGEALAPRRWRKRALLLGPLAVDPAVKSAGIGSALMRHAIAEAARLGHGAVVLVGDAPYYARFGFSSDMTGGLAMPGPYERHRFLALELVPGWLDRAEGVLKPTGRKATPADGRKVFAA